ncbi:MAG: Na+-dependent transporter [Pseudolabrys sp.]|nr:Na+-dependent transporter [Pseudolabrys sp.]
MTVIKILSSALAAIGRHGTGAVAASIFAGMLIPGLAPALKPWLGEAIVALLTLAFLRVQPAALLLIARKPALVIMTAAWVMLVTPALLAFLFIAGGLRDSLPDLYFILILQSCAPSLMSSPAMAALIGVDVALTLASLLLSTALAPLTASVFTHLFLGNALIDPPAFGLKLFLIIAGSALAATIVRRIAGNARIEAHSQVIDGLSVIGMFVFAAAAMDGVLAHAIARPVFVLGLTALTFVIALGMMALTALLFMPAGRNRAFAIGILTGNRNIGLMMTAVGFAVPDLAWLYFGLAQFPIYLLPMALKPLAQRFTEKR